MGVQASNFLLSLWTPRGVFFDCSRIKQHPSPKSAPTGAALAAAPHERAGFARADTPRSILASSSGAGARLRRPTGSVFPVRVD